MVNKMWPKSAYLVDEESEIFIDGDAAAETVGLFTCYGIAVYTRKGNEKRGCLMHYAIGHGVSKYRDTLCRFMNRSRNSEMKKAEVKAVVVLHVGREGMHHEYEKIKSSLKSMKEITKSHLGEDAVFTKLPYKIAYKRNNIERFFRMDLESGSYTSMAGNGSFENYN